MRILLDIQDASLKENISEFLELEGHILTLSEKDHKGKMDSAFSYPELVIYDLLNFQSRPTEAFINYQGLVPFIFLCESEKYQRQRFGNSQYLTLPCSLEALNERILLTE